MIKPVGMVSPAFKQRYVNSDGTSVDVDKEAIRQANFQKKVRNNVENAIKNSEDSTVQSGDVYFAMFSDGSCKLSKEPLIPVCYGGASSVDINKPGWIASEIYANSLSARYPDSSDECGSVRAYGDGEKFATIYPDGDVYIQDVASEIFPEE